MEQEKEQSANPLDHLLSTLHPLQQRMHATGLFLLAYVKDVRPPQGERQHTNVIVVSGLGDSMTLKVFPGQQTPFPGQYITAVIDSVNAFNNKVYANLMSFK